MRAATAILLVLASLSPAGLAAAPVRSLAIPAGRLGAAIVAIGTQAGVTIGIADAALTEIAVPGVHGRMSAAAALRRLLAHSGATMVEVDAATFRIVARCHAAPDRPATPRVAETSVAIATAIVVTASKRAVNVASYPGTVSVVETDAIRPGRLGRGSEALLDLQPALSATHLGPGRNKLFIRGIADSSFNGPTAATVGQYLGETRLNYNAPDPDLALYDIASVEILEGPQGTLYGAGSLGGIIRLVPVPPDLAVASLALSTGVSTTAHGATGGDGALIANLPVVRDGIALRGVVYGGIDGGYIDDPSRNARDINRTTTRGGRATLRIAPAPDWTIDLSGVIQDINSRDGQYAQRGLPPLERDSVLAQPFDNDYALASLVVRHRAGTIDLVSATSAVFHDVASVYDASTTRATPRRYTEDDGITLLTNETRASRHDARGNGWVVGIELLHSTDRLTRTLGPPAAPSRIAGTRNTVEEASVYGEGTRALTRTLSVTAGGRIAYDRTVGSALDAGGDTAPRRHDVSALPSVGLLWKPDGMISLYARYQRGYRSGGLSVAADGVRRFAPDSVATSEIGVRRGMAGDRLRFAAALSFTHWERIQADLVATDGLPYTDNIGTGRVLGFELQSAWRVVDALILDGALFLNQSRLSHPAAGFEGERDATLPNIADVVARVGARFTARAFGRPIALSASLDYVGRSRLGVGTALDLRQGRSIDSAAGLSIPAGRTTISIDITNLADARGNVFALGNPFGVVAGDQMTPLRPRTIRLGATTRF